MEATSLRDLLNTAPAGGSQAVGAGSQAVGAGSQLGRDEFLQLLTIQLRFQDPLNPIKNQEFAAQLAQFSALEQMQQVNRTLENELLLSQSVHNTMATTMIGRTVRVLGDAFEIVEGDAGPPAILAQASAPGAATVRITDAAGDVVHSWTVELAGTDPTRIDWDGTDASGDRLAPGTYRVAVTMDGGEEGSLQALTFIEDVISTIRFRDGVTELLLATVPYTLADVIEIRA